MIFTGLLSISIYAARVWANDLMAETEKIIYQIWAASKFTRKHLPATSINQPIDFMKAAVIVQEAFLKDFYAEGDSKIIYV